MVKMVVWNDIKHRSGNAYAICVSVTKSITALNLLTTNCRNRHPVNRLHNFIIFRSNKIFFGERAIQPIQLFLQYYTFVLIYHRNMLIKSIN